MVSRLRLSAQQIENSRFSAPGELVRYMGAIQAQDPVMCKWAVGCRVPGSTEKDVEAALDRGEILRTHVLRPTWHLVSPHDIRWMLELSAPHIKASMRARNKQLELTPSVFAKSHACLEKALGGGEHLTRDVLVNELQRLKIATHDNRAAHLFAEAELDGLICSGISKGKSATYALLSERAPEAKTRPRDEALAELAHRYFVSHGPATIDDFRWWSGLPAKDSRDALEMAKPRLAHETVDDTVYWMAPGLSAAPKTGVYLLPAFDEFIISYRDRSAALPAEHHGRAVSVNGLFRPVTVVNGRVTGLWKRLPGKGRATLELEPFGKAMPQSTLKKAAKELGRFWGIEVEV